jgi:membrane-associated phospholipid phosphatase
MKRRRMFVPVDLLTATDKVVICYLLMIVALAGVSRERVDLLHWLTIGHLIAIAVVCGLAILSRPARLELHRSVALSGDREAVKGGRAESPEPADPQPGVGSTVSLVARVAHFVHGWYLVPVVPLTFFELSYLIPRVHPRDFDVELAILDQKLFGVHPTVWIERFSHPVLTELLQFVYPTYYFLPIILGAVLWRKRWFPEFYYWIFVIAFGFYLSYLGYFLVPATGPRFLSEIVAAQTRPLEGVWLFSAVRGALDRAEGITRDCFPSGHTEMTLLVLYYARRFHRRTFWWMLPVGIGIIVSTVYLRYHYVVDIIAGGLLAWLVILTGERIYRRLTTTR